jgi:ribosome maturation factor RimP
MKKINHRGGSCKNGIKAYHCTVNDGKELNEGTKSPLFSYRNMFEQQVESLLEKAFEERPDLFLIEKSITTDHQVRIIIDGDKGVTVEDCIFISRAIEHNLDREETDFSLEVLSAGATTPLVYPRQYAKHVGRSLEVKTLEGPKVEGELIGVNDAGVELRWKSREPKPVGKGKHTVVKTAEVPFENIKEAKVKIKF